MAERALSLLAQALPAMNDPPQWETSAFHWRSGGGTRTSASPKAPARRAGSVGVQAGSTDAEGLRVGVDDPDQHLADDPAADGAELLAVVQDVGLLEDVEPQRRLAVPAVLGEADLLGAERGHAEAAGDRLAGGQADGLAALEVAGGQRRVVGARLGPGDLGGQRDQRAGQPRVDALGALRRRVARRRRSCSVQSTACSGGTGPKPIRSGNTGHRAEVAR